MRYLIVALICLCALTIFVSLGIIVLVRDETDAPVGRTTMKTDSSRSMIESNSTGNEPDSLDAHIRQILIPRVSGTAGNVKVRNYIVDELKKNGYHVELDKFTDSTPNGEVEFANIIADSNPKSCRQLVLAAHYDSKLMDGFLGAIDSAVPCAMLLKIANTLRDKFSPTGGDSKDRPGLRFIFFDGEEAVRQWTKTDSLYGSRHLAAKWEKQPGPQDCPGRSELSRIELFVLLDLIGASDSSFIMYNKKLAHHYFALQGYESEYLEARGGVSQDRDKMAFTNGYVPLDYIEDDHVPFHRRGVPVLSLLAHPFPRVWHKVSDNYSAIDFPRTRRILHVIEKFVANYKK